MLEVLNDGNGQMCNKILFQINILASAYVRNYSVTYYNMQKFDGFRLSQEELEKNLVRVDENPKLKYTLTRAIHKGLSKVGVFNKKFVMVGANNQTEAENLLFSNYLHKHTTYLYGWPFYDLTSLRKAGNLVRQYMAPQDDIAMYVQKTMMMLRSNSDIVIGVHLRRGDYKSWRNGIYYYSNAQYKHCMDVLYRNIGKQKKCVFVLFSNENLAIEEFANEQYSTLMLAGNPAQDFHTMASCDYLIGPPSSFSGLASFMGKVPRYMIEDASKDFGMSDMLVWLEETDSWGLPI